MAGPTGPHVYIRDGSDQCYFLWQIKGFERPRVTFLIYWFSEFQHAKAFKGHDLTPTLETICTHNSEIPPNKQALTKTKLLVKKPLLFL